MRATTLVPVLLTILIPAMSFADQNQIEDWSDTCRAPCMQAQEVKEPLCKPICNPTSWAIQARGAAFIPLKKQLREIYGSGLPTLEVESSYSLIKALWQKCDQLLLWENIGWTSKSGRSLGFGYYSKLNLLPIALGIEYQATMGANFDFYVGAGPTYSFLWVKNYDGFNTTYLNRNQFGFTTKTGFRYTFCTNYFFDVFGDYYFTEFRNMDHDPILPLNGHFSGFYVGGGFGGKF